MELANNDSFDDLIMDPENNAQGPEDQTSSEVDPDDWSVPVEESPKDEVKADEEIDKDSQLKSMDVKEDQEDDKKDEKESEQKADDKKEDESEEKQESESKEEESKEPELPKIEGKAVKVFQDGKMFEVPEDGTVKVKVNGKNEKVTIAELKSNFSGHKKWDQEIESASIKNKEAEAKLEEIQYKEKVLNESVISVKDAIEAAIDKGENPMSALGKIVDLLGYNSYDFNEILFESMFDEFNEFSHMTEAEQRAYKLEKKTNYLTQRQESFERQQSEAQAQEERLAAIDEMRGTHGVTEDEFVDAVKRLESIGKTDMTPEQVIMYAANVKYLDPAEELLKPYEDQQSDDEFEHNMKLVASTLKSGDMSREEIADYLAEQFAVTPAIDQINQKAEKTGARQIDSEGSAPMPSQTDLYRSPSLESFDDFN